MIKNSIIKLKEITEVITKGTTPSTYGFNFEENGEVNFIRAEGISKEGYVDESTFLKISPECDVKLKRSRLKKDDILFSIAGMALGKTGIVKQEFLPANTNQAVAIIRPKSDIVFPKYLHYQFINPHFYKVVNSISGQAAQPNINLEQVGSLEISLPPLPTQRKIASILSAYDDLIENNVKRIKLLEELAQRTYEEWFVKFRINGKQLKINKESGLPEGWEKKPFEDLIDFKEGPGLRNSQYREEGIPFLNIRVIKEDEVDFTKVQFLDPNEVNTKYPHFLLKENDHVISTSGTLGRLVTIRKKHLPLCLNTSLIRMRPINDNYGKWLIKHTLTNPKFKELMESYANGSAQKNFGPIHLKQIKLIAPKNEIAKAYEKFADPIEKTIQNLKNQNIKLKESRDILLPRLMGGVIEVRTK